MPDSFPIEELTEDTLLPVLKTEYIGHRLVSLGECESTNLFARRLLESRIAPEHGTVVSADYQWGGRGRNGRIWQARVGLSLLFSIILYPEKCRTDAPFRATMAASVAVASALREAGFDRCSIKWPNDILCPDGRKICGILSETASGSGVPTLITGIGINVNQSKDGFAPGLSDTAISLRMLRGVNVSRLEILARVLEKLEDCLDMSAEELFSAWEMLCSTLGRTIRVRLGDETLVGQAIGLENDGRLIVRLASGKSEAISSGDVEQLRNE
jgi:BirA family transcriptional regulator, biotin operon repressor / biotin---[acetyl-CoA-carboxylase] ligase